MRGIALLAACSVALVIDAFGELSGGFPAPLDHPAIQYDTRLAHDPVAELNRKIQEGKIELRFDGPSGYLRSVLDALGIPIESQLVVFSKTSLQSRIISPSNPRSIFFSDSVAAGFVKGEPFVELAAEDPQQGVIFYTLDQMPTGKPVFQREDRCLQCHESFESLGVPGTLIRSSFVAANGTPLRQLGDYLTDHRSPLGERWGGWYVTSKRDPAPHLGNVLTVDPESAPQPRVSNLASLTAKFDTSALLSPHSDIVALMVFNHQMHMINLLTRMGWDARLASYQRGNGGQAADFTTRLLREDARDLVDYMLFIDEAPLSGKIEGTSGFAEKFAAQGPRDRKGVATRTRPRTRSHALSMQLHDLFARIRRLARGSEGRNLSAHVGNPLRPGERGKVFAAFTRQARGHRGNPARHQEGSAGIFSIGRRCPRARATRRSRTSAVAARQIERY